VKPLAVRLLTTSCTGAGRQILAGRNLPRAAGATLGWWVSDNLARWCREGGVGVVTEHRPAPDDQRSSSDRWSRLPDGLPEAGVGRADRRRACPSSQACAGPPVWSSPATRPKAAATHSKRSRVVAQVRQDKARARRPRPWPSGPAVGAGPVIWLGRDALVRLSAYSHVVRGGGRCRLLGAGSAARSLGYRACHPPSLQFRRPRRRRRGGPMPVSSRRRGFVTSLSASVAPARACLPSCTGCPSSGMRS
jgi:hypothetical protein